MDPDTRDSLAWGLVGGLSFLVLVQGYELVTAQGVAALVKLVGAVVVTALSTASVVFSRRRLPEPVEGGNPSEAGKAEEAGDSVQSRDADETAKTNEGAGGDEESPDR